MVNLPDFKFPRLKMGSHVEVGADPTTQDTAFGWVVKVKSRAVDVLCVYPETGLMLRYDCLHREDPQVLQRPGIFEDETRGVFVPLDEEDAGTGARVARLEKSIHEFVIRSAAIENKIDRLTRRIATAEKDLDSMRPKAHSKARSTQTKEG